MKINTTYLATKRIKAKEILNWAGDHCLRPASLDVACIMPDSWNRAHDGLVFKVQFWNDFWHFEIAITAYHKQGFIVIRIHTGKIDAF